jgi:hypothetical protein
VSTHSLSSQQEIPTNRSSVISAVGFANADTSSVTFPLLPSKKTQVEILLPINVRRGMTITDSCSGRYARITQPFSIIPSLEGGKYLATSSISDIYEMGETLGDAVSRYLSSLVDELLWFGEKKENLSDYLMKNYQILQLYVELV